MSNPENNNEAIEKKLELIDQARKYIKDYQDEQESYKKLWNVFTENGLSEDFKYSRRAALMVIALPVGLNVLFYFRPNIAFKNTLRISVLTASLFNLQYNLDQDYRNLAKKDTPIGNVVRNCMQRIAKLDQTFPYFAKETMDILSNFY